MDNFDDLTLAVEMLESRADMLEIFIARLLAKLIANDHIKPNELSEVIKSLEADFPYPDNLNSHSRDNTMLRYLSKFIFAEIPEVETAKFSAYYRRNPELKNPRYQHQSPE